MPEDNSVMVDFTNFRRGSKKIRLECGHHTVEIDKDSKAPFPIPTKDEVVKVIFEDIEATYTVKVNVGGTKEFLIPHRCDAVLNFYAEDFLKLFGDGQEPKKNVEVGDDPPTGGR